MTRFEPVDPADAADVAPAPETSESPAAGARGTTSRPGAYRGVGIPVGEILRAQRIAADLQRLSVSDVGAARALMPQLIALTDMVEKMQVPATQAMLRSAVLLAERAAFAAPLAVVAQESLAVIAQKVAMPLAALEGIALSKVLTDFKMASLGPLRALTQLTEIQRSVIATSAIQMLTAAPVLDVPALLAVAPTRQMVADVVALTGVRLDYGRVMSQAFAFPAVSWTAAAASAAQYAVAEADDDDLESVAMEAVIEVAPTDIDFAAPPTEEQITAFDALRALVVALRPNLRDEPRVARGIDQTTTGASLALLIYLAVLHPGLLGTLLNMAGILGLAGWVHHGTTGLLLPREANPEDED